MNQLRRIRTVKLLLRIGPPEDRKANEQTSQYLQRSSISSSCHMRSRSFAVKIGWRKIKIRRAGRRRICSGYYGLFQLSRTAKTQLRIGLLEYLRANEQLGLYFQGHPFLHRVICEAGASRSKMGRPKEAGALCWFSLKRLLFCLSCGNLFLNNGAGMFGKMTANIVGVGIEARVTKAGAITATVGGAGQVDFA